MGSGGQMDEGLERKPQLSPDFDPTGTPLTPAEGYLLSRIDGHTPWKFLREIGGVPPDEVDQCLERWLKDGLIVVPTATRKAASSTAKRKTSTAKRKTSASKRKSSAKTSKPSKAAKSASKVEAPKPAIDESLLDSSLEVNLDTQRRILEFQAGLDRDYYQILGVDRDVDTKAIKRAYFKLSKEFHPDRYFRRKIGPYEVRLGDVFKKILEAYELLSDPIARAEIEKSIQASPEAAEQPPVEETVSSEPEEPPRELTPRERLQQRLPFKIPSHLVQERKQKAAEFYSAAMRSERVGSYIEAASSIRLAIAFDPFNSEYTSRFAAVQAKAAELRAAQLLDTSKDDIGRHDEGSEEEALRLLEEVLLYRPHDPEINVKAAGVALGLEKVDQAREYIERAIEHSPRVSGYHWVLAKVHMAAGNRGHAVRELEESVQLDGSNTEARELLAQLKQGRRDAAKGGKR